MNNSKYQQNTTQEIINEADLQKQKQKHLQLLHKYNNLKDATQTVLGALAQAKGLTVKDIHKMYNLPSHD
ncbi:DNA repair protein SWI5 homolog [Drosophila grimshawi]|uniref:DNA repair protein SWI5 homolog n=1 Tax=Drosophila grimshawi TaxID=7222 RepID=B4IXQ4_DROGR|nr:DNA repair protein SWI5 homolog [Drosophila grimshawi]EDV97516.1 GH16914 [Drosophila grimshawi]